ncbi:MAG TPA: SURF1 family protein [Rubrivivax sp.]|nr:SURF1 family protein [Rubrivivax sp.]
MSARESVLLTAVLLLAALTAGLGVWQLGRAAQKTELEQMREARAQLPPLPGEAFAAAEQPDAAWWQRRAVFEGRWLQAETVYLDNRPMNGRPGFYVVTPLLLDDGRAVLVQRGWLPRDAQERTRIAAYDTAATRLHVAGHIAPEFARLYELGGAGTGAIRQNLDLTSYARETRRRLLPLVLVQDEGDDDGLLRQWPRAASDVHRNYGYALQWFGLCALVIGLYVWFRIIQPRRRAGR